MPFALCALSCQSHIVMGIEELIAVPILQALTIVILAVACLIGSVALVLVVLLLRRTVPAITDARRPEQDGDELTDNKCSFLVKCRRVLGAVLRCFLRWK